MSVEMPTFRAQLPMKADWSNADAKVENLNELFRSLSRSLALSLARSLSRLKCFRLLHNRQNNEIQMIVELLDGKLMPDQSERIVSSLSSTEIVRFAHIQESVRRRPKANRSER
jgi:hypothetical protein